MSEYHLDPLLLVVARSWRCMECGGNAYPVDAAWLDEHQGLVLAEFVQQHLGNCPGWSSWCAVIDVAHDAENQRCYECGRPAQYRYCDNCRCLYLIGETRRCKNKARWWCGVCHVHEPLTEVRIFIHRSVPRWTESG